MLGERRYQLVNMLAQAFSLDKHEMLRACKASTTLDPYVEVDTEGTLQKITDEILGKLDQRSETPKFLAKVLELRPESRDLHNCATDCYPPLGEVLKRRVGIAATQSIRDIHQQRAQSVVELVAQRFWVNLVGRPASGKTAIVSRVRDVLSRDGSSAELIVLRYDRDPFSRLLTLLDSLESRFGPQPMTNGAVKARISTLKRSIEDLELSVGKTKQPIVLIIDHFGDLDSKRGDRNFEALWLLLSSGHFGVLTASEKFQADAHQNINIPDLSAEEAIAAVSERLRHLSVQSREEVESFIRNNDDRRYELIHGFLTSIARQESLGEKLDLEKMWSNQKHYQLEKLRKVDGSSPKSIKLLLIANSLGSVDLELLADVLIAEAKTAKDKLRLKGMIDQQLGQLRKEKIEPLLPGWRESVEVLNDGEKLTNDVDVLLRKWAALKTEEISNWQRNKHQYKAASLLWGPLFRVMKDAVNQSDVNFSVWEWMCWIKIARIANHFGSWEIVNVSLEKITKNSNKIVRIEALLEYMRIRGYSEHDEEAEDKANELIAECMESGLDSLLARAHLRLGQIQMRTEPDAARQSISKAIESVHAREFLVAVGFLAEIDVKRGDYSRALTLIQAANAVQKALPETWPRIQAHHLRLEAEILIAHGDWECAKEKYLLAGDLAREWAVDQRLDAWILGGLALCEYDSKKGLSLAQHAKATFASLGSRYDKDTMRLEQLITFFEGQARPVIFIVGSPAAGKSTLSRRLREWLIFDIGIPSTTISIDDAQKIVFPKVDKENTGYQYTSEGALILEKPEQQVPMAYNRLRHEVESLRGKRQWIVIVEFAHPSPDERIEGMREVIDESCAVVIHVEADEQTRQQRNRDRRGGPNFIPEDRVQSYSCDPESVGRISLPLCSIQNDKCIDDSLKELRPFIESHLVRWAGKTAEESHE